MINDAYHSGGTGLGDAGFGELDPPAIITLLQRLYEKPSYQYIKDDLERTNKPMAHSQPIQVMLYKIERVQQFLLQHPEEGRQLIQVNLIGYVIIKLSETGGMYQKALENDISAMLTTARGEQSLPSLWWNNMSVCSRSEWASQWSTKNMELHSMPPALPMVMTR